MSQPWQTDKWFVSPWNYLPEVIKDFAFAEEIRVHDVTLRDGEQQAGIELRKDDKVRIAEGLAQAGVHRIEAGMPAVSRHEQAAIQEIVKRNLGPEVFAFCRCIVDDVRKAADCGVDGIVLEIPSSRHLIQYAYQWSVERALAASIEATSYARELGLYTAFFTIDATREDLDWLLDAMQKIAGEGHMDSLVLVDTFGVCTPQAIEYFVRKVQERIDKPLEAHFHNDFGLAVANTLVALSCGVQVAHTTVAGIGERAGNAALEDVVVALLALYGIDLGMKYDQLTELARLTVDLTGHKLPQNKSIVGEQVFDIESGIIASWSELCTGALATEVFPLDWRAVGHQSPKVVLGKGSGRANVKHWLERIGMRASPEQTDQLVALVKEQALDKKALVTEDEFRRLVDQVCRS